jgi:DNA polymerase-3 subunit epsilon
MKILSEPEALERTLKWLGNYLRRELQIHNWKVDVELFEDEGGTLYLVPLSWRLPGTTNEYVAFSFYWSNDSTGEDPCVQLYLPTEDLFQPRNELLNQIRPLLMRAGFTDHFEGEEDPDRTCPLWKYIRLELGEQNGLDLPRMLSGILQGFQALMTVGNLITDARQSLPCPPPPYEHQLQTIAFLDTEWKGDDPTRAMTELAIVNVAYDPLKDEVVGILEEYAMEAGDKLKPTTARALLERAHRIVAHNASRDLTLLDRELPGVEKKKWVCSLHGMEWRQLTGVRSAGQKSLVARAGLRVEQDHHARADAHDLRRLLAQKHDDGRTYLRHLLDGEAAVYRR